MVARCSNDDDDDDDNTDVHNKKGATHDGSEDSGANNNGITSKADADSRPHLWQHYFTF